MKAPACCPAPDVKKVGDDVADEALASLAKALAHPTTREKLKNLGADPMPVTAAQFDALVRQEIEVNTQLVKAAGIKVN